MSKTNNNTNFEEIAAKYSSYKAIAESSRCLMCDDAPCQAGCPANIRVADFLRKIRTGDFIGAAKIIRDDNVFGASCARICPTERLCQENCSGNKLEKPIDIPGLQRFVSDYQIQSGLIKSDLPELNGKKVAIIGAGPGGLAAAFELRKFGIESTIFEAQNYAGGLLRSGIPSYRLPKDILQSEIDFIIEHGIKINFNQRVESLSKITESYDAVYISIGLEEEKPMNINGTNLNGVYNALEFLKKTYIDDKITIGSRVAVIGGGDVAMDCARTAIRLNGVNDVFIIYRRSIAEMPAQKEEIEAATEEGVIFQTLLTPNSIEGNDNVEKLICNQVKLSEPDESGRRKPVIINDSKVIFDIDTVIFAIGQESKADFFAKNPDIKTNKRGLIEINPETFETSIPGIFAGGDITGGTTAVEAIGNAKKAAISIYNKLCKGN